jgi:predicted enzyme related to lactoylglutathione lyase
MTPKQQQRANRVVWFEIPVADMDRACRFYETILSVSLRRAAEGPQPIAVFPYEAPAVSGCLALTSDNRSGATGSLVYLNADPNLADVLARVEANGGKVVTPKTALPQGTQMGYFARITDTEGNTVGLHAIS